MGGDDYILVARGLQKSFGSGAARVCALRQVDLRVRRGEFLAVMGPSGSGKSTLLHVLGLMTPPDAGSIDLDGLAVPDDDAARTELRRRHIGFVFQRFNLLSVLSAADNVAISLRIRRIKPDGRVEQFLDRVGVGHVAGRKPAQMSVGEEQRVAVVRAMAHRPALLLADEPTGNLDSAAAGDLLSLFQHMNRQDNQTIVMITHSAQAAAYAGRVVHMKDGTLNDGNC
jgi:putative ABC transport system ATP-binding protein